MSTFQYEPNNLLRYSYGKCCQMGRWGSLNSIDASSQTFPYKHPTTLSGKYLDCRMFETWNVNVSSISSNPQTILFTFSDLSSFHLLTYPSRKLTWHLKNCVHAKKTHAIYNPIYLWFYLNIVYFLPLYTVYQTTKLYKTTTHQLAFSGSMTCKAMVILFWMTCCGLGKRIQRIHSNKSGRGTSTHTFLVGG